MDVLHTLVGDETPNEWIELPVDQRSSLPHNPPSTMYIDEAVARIVKRLSCPPWFATNLLLEAIGARELQASDKRGELPPSDAKRLRYLPYKHAEEIRTGQPHASLFVGRECIHPHAITLVAREFEYWLKLQAERAAASLLSGNVPSPQNFAASPAQGLPLWLTPMQAVAWVCTRNFGAVWRADLERGHQARLDLPEEFIDEWFPPSAGLTLLTLDAWHDIAHEEQAWVLPTEPALEQLTNWFRGGQVRTTGLNEAEDRTPIDPAAWRFMILSAGPNERELVPHRAPPHSGQDRRWHEVLISQDDLLGVCQLPTEVQMSPAVTSDLPMPSRDPQDTVAPPAIPRRLAIPNKPGGGGTKRTAAIEAMIRAVEEGRLTFDVLRRMPQKKLVEVYSGAGRTLLTECREIALQRLRNTRHADKAAT